MYNTYIYIYIHSRSPKEVLVMDKVAFFVEKFVLSNVQAHQSVFPSLTHFVCVSMSDLQSVCSILLLTGLDCSPVGSTSP